MPNPPDSVEPQVTESFGAEDNPQMEHSSVEASVTETNLLTLGSGPPTSVGSSYLAQAHAHAALFTDAVQQQSLESLTGLSVAVASVRRIFNRNTEQ
jgi:hypothetical protein